MSTSFPLSLTFPLFDGLTVSRMVFSSWGRGDSSALSLSVGVGFHRRRMLTFNVLHLHLQNPCAFFSNILLTLFQLQFEFLDTATRDVVLGFQVGQFGLYDTQGIYDVFLAKELGPGTC